MSPAAGTIAIVLPLTLLGIGAAWHFLTRPGGASRFSVVGASDRVPLMAAAPGAGQEAANAAVQRLATARQQGAYGSAGR